MPVIIHCLHCETAELQLKEENKGPDGLLECPKCGCTFRVCLAIYNGKCYVKMNPNAGQFREEKKKEEKTEWMGGPTTNIPPEKKKRGRPRKEKPEVMGSIAQDVPEKKKIDVVEEMHKQEDDDELNGTSYERKE